MRCGRYRFVETIFYFCLFHGDFYFLENHQFFKKFVAAIFGLVIGCLGWKLEPEIQETRLQGGNFHPLQGRQTSKATCFAWIWVLQPSGYDGNPVGLWLSQDSHFFKDSGHRKPPGLLFELGFGMKLASSSSQRELGWIFERPFYCQTSGG